MAAKSTEPKRWRIVGVSDDGVKVTLGRYETREEADRDRTRIETDGFYTEIDITEIELPPAPEEDALPPAKGK